MWRRWRSQALNEEGEQETLAEWQRELEDGEEESWEIKEENERFRSLVPPISNAAKDVSLFFINLQKNAVMWKSFIYQDLIKNISDPF